MFACLKGSGNYMEPTGLSQFETQQLMSASLPFQSISMGLAQSPPYSSQFANLYEQGAQRILDRNAFAEYNGYQPAVDVNRLNEIFLQALEAQSQFHPGLFDGASGPREVALTNHNQQPNGESQFGRDTNMMEETVEGKVCKTVP